MTDPESSIPTRIPDVSGLSLGDLARRPDLAELMEAVAEDVAADPGTDGCGHWGCGRRG